MKKYIKYFIVIIFIFVLISIITMYNKQKNTNTIVDEAIENKVFENPEKIVYLVNNNEKFILTKEDEDFNKIMEKLNNSVTEQFINDKEGTYLLMFAIDIEKEIYQNASILRLIYSESNETDIVFGKDKGLDIMYINNELEDFYGGLDKNKKEELKKMLDGI